MVGASNGGGAGESDSDDDEKLQERIRRKQREFEARMREREGVARYLPPPSLPSLTTTPPSSISRSRLGLYLIPVINTMIVQYGIFC